MPGKALTKVTIMFDRRMRHITMVPEGYNSPDARLLTYKGNIVICVPDKPPMMYNNDTRQWEQLDNEVIL